MKNMLRKVKKCSYCFRGSVIQSDTDWNVTVGVKWVNTTMSPWLIYSWSLSQMSNLFAFGTYKSKEMAWHIYVGWIFQITSTEWLFCQIVHFMRIQYCRKGEEDSNEMLMKSFCSRGERSQFKVVIVFSFLTWGRSLLSRNPQANCWTVMTKIMTIIRFSNVHWGQ